MIFKSPRPDVVIPDQDLVSFVLARCAELADRPALIDGLTGRQISFEQLQIKVNKMAAGLHQRGFSKGDVLAIFCPNVPEYGVAFLGTAAIGGINTTVNSLYSERELIHQLQDSRAKFLFTIPAFLDRALPAAKQAGIQEIFVLGSAAGATPFAELLDNDGHYPPVIINAKKDLVALPYSSGTTGLSKGVMLTHYNLIANITLSSLQNQVDENDTLIAVLPFFHIYGMVLILCLSIYRGCCLVTLPRFDLEQFLQVVQDNKVSCLSLVPPLILALAKHPSVDNYDLSSLRLISSGAAPLGEDVEKACAERLNCIVYQGYGLTEVGGASHINYAEMSITKSGSVGPTLPNTLTKIIDTKSGAELGPKQEGEVCIYGPHVMRGYLNNVEATAATIDDEGWLHTGDIGYVDDDAFVYIIDRVKELIKYKAYQVAPAELEAILVTHPDIIDAAVVPSPDEEAGEVPKAFVVLRKKLSTTDILQFVNDQVAPHKKIRKLEFIDEIPKSAAGKILRRVLVDRDRKTGRG